MSTYSKGSCLIRTGSYESIPSDASPGLLFLKQFLPILDSLDEDPPIAQFVSPDVRFIINQEAPTSLAKLAEMLGMRRERVRLFKHDVFKAFEIQREMGFTVIFESTSTTQFNGDDVKLVVAEVNIWELERQENSGELQLVEARCWMDPSAIQRRAKEIFSQ